jgi:hypothetical protein
VFLANAQNGRFLNRRAFVLALMLVAYQHFYQHVLFSSLLFSFFPPSTLSDLQLAAYLLELFSFTILVRNHRVLRNGERRKARQAQG